MVWGRPMTALVVDDVDTNAVVGEIRGLSDKMAITTATTFVII